MILKEKNVIFIHIPKTGGGTISNLLIPKLNIHNKKFNEILYGVKNNKSLHHLTALEIKNIIDNYDNYFKFTVIRNPYDKILSEYYWCQIKDVGYKFNKSFDFFLNYVKKIVENEDFNKNLYTDHFIPQYKFIYDNDNNIIVDKIFRYENFDYIFKFLKEKFNIIKSDHNILNHNTQVKKINLNFKQKSIIYELYKKDFQLFNYLK